MYSEGFLASRFLKKNAKFCFFKRPPSSFPPRGKGAHSIKWCVAFQNCKREMERACGRRCGYLFKDFEDTMKWPPYTSFRVAVLVNKALSNKFKVLRVVLSIKLKIAFWSETSLGALGGEWNENVIVMTKVSIPPVFPLGTDLSVQVRILKLLYGFFFKREHFYRFYSLILFFCKLCECDAICCELCDKYQKNLVSILFSYLMDNL